jgi:N-acetyl-alpha-D-glucosaminyl L-malate synthase BshA
VASELAAALARRGHEVHVVACERPLRLRDVPGLTFHGFEIYDYPLFRFPPHDLCLITKIAEVAERYDIEVIHAHYAIPHALAALVAREMVHPRRPAVVTTLHGTDVTLVGSHPSFFTLTKHAMRRGDGLTAVSAWLKRTTSDVFGTEIVPSVIPNFVDTDRFHPEGRVPYPDGGMCELVHASNFRPVKRVTDIVRAFHLIRKELPARLTLVGTGPEMGSVRELVAELNLCDAVRFNGLASDLPPLLQRSHLLFLLSDYESFGVSALEAMACGVPVIVSDAGGLPEVVRTGETGYLCRVGDYRCAAENALAVLGDRAAWNRMSAQAAEDARTRFAVERVVPRYEAYYEHVLNGLES